MDHAGNYRAKQWRQEFCVRDDDGVQPSRRITRFSSGERTEQMVLGVGDTWTPLVAVPSDAAKWGYASL